MFNQSLRMLYRVPQALSFAQQRYYHPFLNVAQELIREPAMSRSRSGIQADAMSVNHKNGWLNLSVFTACGNSHLPHFSAHSSHVDTLLDVFCVRFRLQPY